MGRAFLQAIIIIFLITLSTFSLIKYRKNKKKKDIEAKNKARIKLLEYNELVVNANTDFKSHFSFYLSAISKIEFLDWQKANREIYNGIQKYNIDVLLEGQELNEFTEFVLAYSKGWDIIQKFNQDYYKFNNVSDNLELEIPVVIQKTVTKVRSTTELKPKEPIVSYPFRKENWEQYKKFITDNGIEKLFHFTDEKNLESIILNKGLYSWHDCINKNITIVRPGGNQLSRDLDRRSGLEDFVRLSFNRNHPMMYVAKKDGRISNPIILEISTDIIYLKDTKFSNINANSNNAIVGVSFQNLKNINFQIAKSNIPYYNLAETNKPYFQAEVLVKNHIPIDKILNINQL